jgi:hypothetical protein
MATQVKKCDKLGILGVEEKTMKTNIFQGDFGESNPIQKVLFPDFKIPNNGYGDDYEVSKKTREIYFQAFFYLTKRFGESNKHRIDDCKHAGRWDFAVKNYQITVLIDSCSVNFIVFGKRGSFLSSATPYNVKKERFALKSDKVINIFDVQEKDTAAINQLATEFCAEKGIDDNWDSFAEKINTDIQLWQDFSDKIFRHNHQVQGFSIKSINEKHGTYYDNAEKRRARRTLEQFLKNMLSPISVRDCSFNITGIVSDADYFKFSGFADNIKIDRLVDNESL